MWPPADKSLNARLKDKIIWDVRLEGKVLWDVYHIVRSEIISPGAEQIVLGLPGLFTEDFSRNIINIEHSLNAKLKRYRL